MRVARLHPMIVFAAAVLVAAPMRAPAQDAPKRPDVTGKSVESEAGSGTPTVTFKQAGDSISGRYSSQALGEHDCTGTFKDGKLAFGFSADVGGQQFSMDFAGTLDGADEMKGTIEFGGGLGSGTFTAKRIKAPPK